MIVRSATGLSLLVLSWLLASTSLVAAGLPVEETSWSWQPRERSIRILTGPDSVMRVQGHIASGWNYIITDHRAITPGRLYRLSAALHVDHVGPGTPPPYLKCEFVGPPARREAGQVHTEPYDTRKMPSWQTLTCEFLVPQGTTACWLAVEKGTSGPAEVDLLMKDVRLEPIARLSALERYRLDPLPTPLQVMRGVHPRIHLTAERAAELRRAVKTTHAAIWAEVRAQADRAARRGPPAYQKDDRHSGDEQLWQREVGNTQALLAAAYVVSGDSTYLDAARKWALASCAYPTWGLGRIDGMDLATGHQLYGLALVYDWCFRDLDEPTRRTIRETLVKRASAMYEAAATGKAWWRRSYLQNHLWVDSTGLAAAGFALFDEVDEAPSWIGFPLAIFRETEASLGPDGASHEGVGYWEYGVEYLLKFADLARTLLNVDLTNHPWWRNTPFYALHLSLPRNAWTRTQSIVDLADCPRTHWYGPDYLLRRLASLNRDGHAQWLAVEVDRARVASTEVSWLNLLWYDPTIEPTPPGDLPTFHHFDDMGIVAARSGWSGDESLVVFKCGPFIGHEAVQRFAYDPGGGHVHPDANHLVFFGAGEWLLRDDGYRPKWTGQHNTLLVNHQGQMGEGQQWFDGAAPLARKARPSITSAIVTPLFDHVVGDATAAYAPELGLERFVRHVLFLKPDAVVVVDEIATRTDADLELRFHPESAIAVDGAAFVARGKTATLRIEPLTRAGVTVTQGTDPAFASHGGSKQILQSIRLATRRKAWRNAVAFSWSPNAQRPVPVSLNDHGDRWTFQHGPVTLSLVWSTGKVE